MLQLSQCAPVQNSVETTTPFPYASRSRENIRSRRRRYVQRPNASESGRDNQVTSCEGGNLGGDESFAVAPSLSLTAEVNHPPSADSALHVSLIVNFSKAISLDATIGC